MRFLWILPFLILTGFNRHGHRNPEPLFDMINEYRRANRLPELQYYYDMQGYTDEWSKKQTRYLQHAEGPFSENCAGSYQSMEGVLNGWKKSPGHNRNLLDKNIKYAVVSVYVLRQGEYELHYAVFRGYKKKEAR